ncbi:ROK family transcriptional regulator [Novosphingobium flavum]|uniref:ROK family transcriptional regulator n=1 Tax=Novosphingobium flavum TaxID=1778672 RepID=A0A7X1FTG8_9SPHN|nr:ROK family transcriptional regulator [Novosphingobium flavum]MBC2666694.1 ROK family transcriptional regulator [Novosphingobium flavum]
MATPPLPTKRGARIDRATNTKEILSFLRASGPSTQADIARATGLSRATVNHIVQTLRDQGAIEYQWKNRREALVTLTSTRDSVASVIVREHTVHAILFDFTAQERFDVYSSDFPEIDEPQTSPAMVLGIVNRLAALAKARNAPLAGIALAIEGPVERESGAIAPWAWHRLPHWKQVNIRQYISRHLRIPLVIDNDANFAALGEWTWGVGRGCNDFLHITSSEGIGGGIVINGRIYHGGTGLAGEIGHMVIEDAGELCFCGSRGCLTSFATERAILRALGNTGRPRTSLREVIDGAQHGDAACQRVLSEAGQHLGKALATVVRVIGPSVIAIGGTLGWAGDIVLDGLRSCAEVINLRAIGKAPDIKVAEILEHATELGGLAAILSELDLGASSLVPWMVAPRPLAAASA